jgi:hypothetical protein
MQTTAGRDSVRPVCGWTTRRCRCGICLLGSGPMGQAEHSVSWRTAACVVILFGKHFWGLPGRGGLGWVGWQIAAQRRYGHRKRKVFLSVVSAGFQPIRRGFGCLWGQLRVRRRAFSGRRGLTADARGDLFLRWGRVGDQGGKVGKDADPEASNLAAIAVVTGVGRGLVQLGWDALLSVRERLGGGGRRRGRRGFSRSTGQDAPRTLVSPPADPASSRCPPQPLSSQIPIMSRHLPLPIPAVRIFPLPLTNAFPMCICTNRDSK